MKKRLAQFLCIMLWIGISTAIVLGILFYMEKIPPYRILDILSISFFLSLAAMTSWRLDEAYDRKISAAFDYIFLTVLLTPMLFGRNYPAIYAGHAEWLFFLFCPLIFIVVIVIAVAKRNKEGAFEECMNWIAVICWSILLGVCAWFSIMKGVWVSYAAIIMIALAAVLSAFFGFLFWALVHCIIRAVITIINLHRFAFGDKG